MKKFINVGLAALVAASLTITAVPAHANTDVATKTEVEVGKLVIGQSDARVSAIASYAKKALEYAEKQGKTLSGTPGTVYSDAKKEISTKDFVNGLISSGEFKNGAEVRSRAILKKSGFKITALSINNVDYKLVKRDLTVMEMVDCKRQIRKVSYTANKALGTAYSALIADIKEGLADAKKQKLSEYDFADSVVAYVTTNFVYPQTRDNVLTSEEASLKLCTGWVRK